MQKVEYQPKGLKVEPLSRKKIRKECHFLLDNLGSYKAYPLPIVDIIEAMDEDNQLDFVIVGDKVLDDVAARLTPRKNDIPLLEIKESVYEDACNDDYFSRFTLAHELGHFFLHSSQVIRLNRETSSSHKAYEDTEWQANTFAAELLVDIRIAKDKCRCASDVSKLFGVSKETAEIQWKETLKNEK